MVKNPQPSACSGVLLTAGLRGQGPAISDPDRWTGVHHARFRLTEPYLHHHAKKVLAFDDAIEDHIRSAVALMDEVACFTRGRRKATCGIEPKHLNRHLRDRLKEVSGDWTFETTVLDGVFYDHGEHAGAAVGGFDISRYDTAHNLVQLRNACFGRRPRHDGPRHWEQELAKRPHWQTAAAGIDWTRCVEGKDHELPATKPTILGELQFGNWALAYRDYLKVLSAHHERDIDLFIYIVPAGELKRMLSDGIVTFDNAPRFLESVARAVNVPTVIWGIDVEVGEWKAPLDEATVADMGKRVARRPG